MIATPHSKTAPVMTISTRFIILPSISETDGRDAKRRHGPGAYRGLARATLHGIAAWGGAVPRSDNPTSTKIFAINGARSIVENT